MRVSGEAVRVMVAAVALLLTVGMVPQAAAVTARPVASDASEWVRFAEWTQTVRHCASHKAFRGLVPSDTTGDLVTGGWGRTRHRQGRPCRAAKLPAGYLGNRLLLQNSDGVICGDTQWRFSSSRTTVLQVNLRLRCNYEWYRSVTLGAVYRKAAGRWETADRWVSTSMGR